MSEMFSAGTAVFFTVLTEDGELSEKEGEVRAAFDDEGTAGRTYEIHVHAEDRVYTDVPEAAVRELTAASGVEDGEYGFSAADVERDFMRTVESLWYGMDPRGDEHDRLDAEEEAILLRALNEDASGFAIDTDDPPEEED